MATFKAGDYVQITPSSDPTWFFWGPLHEEAKGGGGIIIQAELDPGNGNGALLEVEVRLSSGKERLIFKDSHLILSTKYDTEWNEHYKQAAEDLQNWEKFSREKTDEMLRYIFGKEKKQETPDYDPNEFILADYPDEVFPDEEDDPWEVITQPMVPLPGLMSNKASKSGHAKVATSKKRTSDPQKTHSLPDYTDEELEELLDSMYSSD